MSREQELVAMLAEEDSKSREKEAEELPPAREKTLVEFVAEIISQRDSDVRISERRTAEIEYALTAAYFTSSPASYDGKQDWLERVLLAEAGSSLLEKRYDARQGIAQLAVRIAADAYNDVFLSLCQQVYLEQKKQKKEGMPEVPLPSAEVSEEEDILGVYLMPTEAVLAATRYAKTVKGFEKAVLRCMDCEDLSYVAAAKAYHDIIPTKAARQAIIEQMENPQSEPKNLFLFSIMTMHKAFMNYFKD